MKIQKLIISSIAVFVMFGCNMDWVDKERKCHGSDYESGYDLGGRWVSWYLSWKCEVRKDPKDMKHIKRMWGGIWLIYGVTNAQNQDSVPVKSLSLKV